MERSTLKNVGWDDYCVFGKIPEGQWIAFDFAVYLWHGKSWHRWYRLSVYRVPQFPGGVKEAKTTIHGDNIEPHWRRLEGHGTGDAQSAPRQLQPTLVTSSLIFHDQAKLTISTLKHLCCLVLWLCTPHRLAVNYIFSYSLIAVLFQDLRVLVSYTANYAPVTAAAWPARCKMFQQRLSASP